MQSEQTLRPFPHKRQDGKASHAGPPLGAAISLDGKGNPTDCTSPALNRKQTSLQMGQAILHNS